MYLSWSLFCPSCFKLWCPIIFGIADFSSLAVFAFMGLNFRRFLSIMASLVVFSLNMCFVLSFLAHFSANLLQIMFLLSFKVLGPMLFNASEYKSYLPDIYFTATFWTLSSSLSFCLDKPSFQTTQDCSTTLLMYIDPYCPLLKFVIFLRSSILAYAFLIMLFVFLFHFKLLVTIVQSNFISFTVSMHGPLIVSLVENCLVLVKLKIIHFVLSSFTTIFCLLVCFNLIYMEDRMLNLNNWINLYLCLLLFESFLCG